MNGKRMFTKEEALGLVKKDGFKLTQISPSYTNDADVVLEAIKTNENAFQFANPELKKNQDVLLQALRIEPKSLYFMDESLKDNRDFALKAFKQYRDDNPGQFERHSQQEGKPYFDMDHPVHKFSESIQAIAKNGDPVQQLETTMAFENIQQQLKPKAPTQTRSLKI
jgi:hypothetical protein